MIDTWPLQQSIFAALTAEPASFPVYDAVPQGAAYPYLVIGEFTGEPDADLAVSSIDLALVLHAWSRTAGKKQTHEMLEFVRARLDAQEIEGAWAITEDFLEIMEDQASTEAARIYHGIARYRVRADGAVVEPPAPPVPIALVASTSRAVPNGSFDVTAPIDTTGASLITVELVSIVVPTEVFDSNGNVWTLLAPINAHRIAYCLNPIVGPGHTFWNAHGVGAMAVQAWSNAGAFDQQSGAAAASGTVYAPGTVTPTEAGELVIGSAKLSDSGPVSANTPMIEIAEIPLVPGVNHGIVVAYEIQTTPTPRNPTFTATLSAAWDACAATFKAAP